MSSATTAAVAWLARKEHRPQEPVRDYRLRDRFSDLPFLHTTAVVTLEALGLDPCAPHRGVRPLQAIERLNPDGLWRFGTLKPRTDLSSLLPVLVWAFQVRPFAAAERSER
jgi:hypothetical protein